MNLANMRSNNKVNMAAVEWMKGRMNEVRL